MSPVAYDLLSDRETSPFEGLAPDDSREVTFHVGARCDRALLHSGLSGEIDWLWAGRIPNGRVTLIEGPAGAGKSLVALDLAARLSDDRPWPDGIPQARRGLKALILCRQDDPADVVGARLKAMGANSQRCVQFHEFETIDHEDRLDIRPLALPLDLPAVGHLLRRDPS
ncbi:MAG: AAA family ATPase, partial [Planctomycetia bacterium]|nr:AAA family ATPase [Planctomycetia bacterium]